MARPSVSIPSSVNITNQLSEKILIVHCQSKDTDLGAHALAVGASFHWSFGTNFFGGTLFWCKLAVENRRISFVAYKEYYDVFKVTVTYGDWVVRDDGVYARPYGRPTFLVAAWTRP
ncbi:unnamed protein product [Linum tenue]|uniref:S-protein homolog n=1 Tax=Linum tenue TaxID=586396 RepID=A0AAV0IBE6_9ROSI|nr:unnamed protein product [Linum tenue]